MQLVHMAAHFVLYHTLAVAVGASLGVIGGLAGLIVAIVLFGLLLIW